MLELRIPALKAAARSRAPGYLDDLLARGQRVGGRLFILLSEWKAVELAHVGSSPPACPKCARRREWLAEGQLTINENKP